MIMVPLSDGTERPVATPGQPLNNEVAVVKLPSCPNCEGRGWFLINPFATGGSNGAGDLPNMTQCQQCYNAFVHFQEHGRLPEAVR